MNELNGDLKAGLQAFEAEDYTCAFQLLVPVAEQGDAQAQCNVARMYHFGLGVEADGLKAVEWYTKAGRQEIQAARSISALAYHNLGTLFSTGAPGVPRSMEMAKDCWRKSLNLGSNLVPREWGE